MLESRASLRERGGIQERSWCFDRRWTFVPTFVVVLLRLFQFRAMKGGHWKTHWGSLRDWMATSSHRSKSSLASSLLEKLTSRVLASCAINANVYYERRPAKECRRRSGTRRLRREPPAIRLCPLQLRAWCVQSRSTQRFFLTKQNEAGRSNEVNKLCNRRGWLIVKQHYWRDVAVARRDGNLWNRDVTRDTWPVFGTRDQYSFPVDYSSSLAA